MYKIADLYVDLQLDNDFLYEDRFDAYKIKNNQIIPDILIKMSWEPIHILEDMVLIPFNDMNCSVYHKQNKWLLYWENQIVCPYAIEANDRWSEITFYVSEDGMRQLYEINKDTYIVRRKILIFQAIMQMFRFAIPFFNGIYLHGVLLKYNGYGIGFSASSGTGKTTHTQFWEENYPVSILNGDNIVLRKVDNQIFAYGVPWCGSSNIFKNVKIPYYGTVFLNQGEKNIVEHLKKEDAFMEYLMRTFMPRWNEYIVGNAMDFIEKLVNESIDCRLFCLPEREASEVLKQWIDKMMSESEGAQFDKKNDCCR